MEAQAIWWRIEDGDGRDARTLRARGEHGIAMFRVSIHGASLISFFGNTAADKWEDENANPRRQDRNTLTKASATRLSADTMMAAHMRIVEAVELYKVDPAMREVYQEAAEARALLAACDLAKVIAKQHPFPEKWLEGRHSSGLSDIWYATTEVDKFYRTADVAHVNPWMSDARDARRWLETWEDRAAVRNKRIVFVLFGDVPG